MQYMLELARNYKRALVKNILKISVDIKWRKDRQYLPLTNDHKELYYIIHDSCWRRLKRFPDIVNCRDFNDKIQWLKLFDQRLDTITCVDKLAVRDFVARRVGSDCLTEVYQQGEDIEQINFGTLPDKFVLKNNHDCGSTLVVRNKNKIDCKNVVVKFRDALKRTYGWYDGEWPYSYVKPKVYAEEIIPSCSQSPPADYKFHCVDGKVKFIQYISDRGVDTNETVVLPDGSVSCIHIDMSMKHGGVFDLPHNWHDLKNVAECLSSGFKFVRIDLYSTKNKVYFGEMTFFPAMGCYTGSGQATVSHYLDFNRDTYLPILINQLAKKYRY